MIHKRNCFRCRNPYEFEVPEGTLAGGLNICNSCKDKMHNSLKESLKQNFDNVKNGNNPETEMSKFMKSEMIKALAWGSRYPKKVKSEREDHGPSDS